MKFWRWNDPAARPEEWPSACQKAATWSNSFSGRLAKAPGLVPLRSVVALGLCDQRWAGALKGWRVLAAYLSEQSGASGNLQMTTATLEVLACIAFRQSISQAEIYWLLDADKRGLVVKLGISCSGRCAGAHGCLRFATTEAF